MQTGKALSFLRTQLKLIILLALVSILCFFSINIYMQKYARSYIYESIQEVPEGYTALVLGAFVHGDGAPSQILEDRLETALELYHQHKIKRFLLSGDHGTQGYDEVNNMKDYLLMQGVDTADIFLDHAGFDTYNSVVRAKEIFDATDMVIITQEFHLSRAVYIARKKGLNATGMVADKHRYPSLTYLRVRESMAMVKAFGEVMINRDPVFGGEKIPITGDSRLSYD
jgi:SanA protein